jgi:preprotein translocase subunit YajC
MDGEMLSLTSPAYAQSPTPVGADFLSFLPLVAVLLILYFFFFRTQQKKEKQHKALVEGLRQGDRVLTNSGLLGTIAKVDAGDQEILLEIAEGVRVRFLKSMVSSVVGKGTLGKESPSVSPSKLQVSQDKVLASKRKTSPSKPPKTSS